MKKRHLVLLLALATLLLLPLASQAKSSKTKGKCFIVGDCPVAAARADLEKAIQCKAANDTNCLQALREEEKIKVYHAAKIDSVQCDDADTLCQITLWGKTFWIEKAGVQCD